MYMGYLPDHQKDGIQCALAPDTSSQSRPGVILEGGSY